MILTIILAVALAISLLTRPKVVTLTEDKPNGNRPVDKGMKFANEVAPYIKEKDGKITIKIVR